MINFCKQYNKVMKRLKDKHTTVNSVNVVSGTIQIVMVVSAIILKYIMKPFILVFEYIIEHTHIPKTNLRYDYLSPLLFVIFLLFFEIIVGCEVNHWIIWLILSPFLYITIILALVCIIAMLFSEDICNKTFKRYVEYPLNYIINKTTSYCDLKK